MAAKKRAATKSAAKAKTKATTAKVSAKEAALQEARLSALPKELAEKAPDMPAKALGKDMLELERVVKPYRAKVLRLPDFDATCLGELKVRAEWLIDADLALGKARKAQARRTGGDEPVAKAIRLRADVIAGGRFLFRKNPDALALLASIAEGDGIDDLVTDMGDLADFTEANAQTFALDEKLPPNVHEVLRGLAGDLLGRTDSSEVAAAVAHRNKCFWLANAAFDEVYEGLGFALRGGPVDRADLFRPYRARITAAMRLRKANAERRQRAGGPTNG